MILIMVEISLNYAGTQTLVYRLIYWFDLELKSILLDIK